MFLKLLIFWLFISEIRATGEFTVLSSPDSMRFEKASSLDSAYVGDVILAALGYAVTGETKWPGLVIDDPFNLARTNVIIIHVNGVYSIPTSEPLRIYEMHNSYTDDSLDELVAELSNDTVKDISFLNHTAGMKQFQDVIGDTEAPFDDFHIYLKPKEYLSHSDFVEEVGCLHAASEYIKHLLKPSHVLILRFTLARIAKVSKYATINEAKTMLASAIDNLLAVAQYKSDALLFVVTTDKHLRKLSTSSLRGRSGKQHTNPFEDVIKNHDHPILINIVIWFTLGFSLALAAICYVIVTMDPGRDTLLYRVSNTGIMLKKHH